MKHPLEPTTYTLPAGWHDSLNQPTRLPDAVDAMGYAFEAKAHYNRVAAEEAHSAAMIAHDIDPEAARSIAQMFAAGCPAPAERTDAEIAAYLADTQIARFRKSDCLQRIVIARNALDLALSAHESNGGGSDYVDAMMRAGEVIAHASRGLRVADETLSRGRT